MAAIYAKADNQWQAPLHIATKIADVGIMQMLIHQCAPLEAKDHMGFTPLPLAVRLSSYIGSPGTAED
jgi:hypothetical protein